MPGSGGKNTPLPLRQKRLFLAQFEKDLGFYNLFLLLANKSQIIRHMGILWAADGPAGELGVRHTLDTKAALHSPFSRDLERDDEIDPDFCRVVNGSGAHEAESCGVSDRAAEARCRETGRTQIYTCHAGLIDIAVPVINEGQYIGTLLAGQFLRRPPSKTGFREIRKNVAALAYIDPKQLEAAYWRVPVLPEEEVRRIVQLLEAFAEFLARSWGRLRELAAEQHRTIRDAELLQKEFAHVALEGLPPERSAMQDMLDRLGFTLVPNRVLVVSLEAQSGGSYDVARTAAWHAVEEIAGTVENCAPAWLRKQGICVFLRDRGGQARAVARRIREAVETRSRLRARIGIGAPAPDTLTLARSYDEACIALTQSSDSVCVYRDPAPAPADLAAAGERICASLLDRRFDDAQAAMEMLPALANRRLGACVEAVAPQCEFFRSTLLPVCVCAKQLGADAAAIDRARMNAEAATGGAASPLDLHTAWRQFSARLLDEVRKLYATRQDKLVDRAAHIVDKALERAERISSSQVARELAVSVSHLGRSFKQANGVTFERFVMNRRIEFARRLLLDPAYNVSQVAQKCGFSDPAYFTRVFRQVAGCAPRAYMQDPLSASTPITAAPRAAQPPRMRG